MSFRFFDWLTQNRDVFARYKASLSELPPYKSTIGLAEKV
jgi:hypothetical protein